MYRSCGFGRSCQHLVGLREVGDHDAGAGAVRRRLTFVRVTGEKDACAVAEVGAEQRGSDPEELLILVIPDLGDGLSADAVHVLLLRWLLRGMLLRTDVDRPGAMAGLRGHGCSARPRRGHRGSHLLEDPCGSKKDVDVCNCAVRCQNDDVYAFAGALADPATPDEDAD